MWVARDRNGDLFLYTRKSERNKILEMFESEPNNGIEDYMRLSKKMHPDVTWDNSPRKVKLIKIELEG